MIQLIGSYLMIVTSKLFAFFGSFLFFLEIMSKFKEFLKLVKRHNTSQKRKKEYVKYDFGVKVVI